MRVTLKEVQLPLLLGRGTAGPHFPYSLAAMAGHIGLETQLWPRRYE